MVKIWIDKMNKKCIIENEKFVIPCEALQNSSEYGHPRGKKKGVFSWSMTKDFKPSRTFFGVKSGDFIEKGIAFNYCPFCGENIDIF